MKFPSKCFEPDPLRTNLFLYSKLIREICFQHDLLYSCYADDTQVYIAIQPRETWLDIPKKMESCLANSSTWMSANMLKLNQEKTALIVFNPKYKSTRMTDDIQLQVGGMLAKP